MSGSKKRPREESESSSAGARARGGGAPRAGKKRPREESESSSAGARARGGGAPRAIEETLLDAARTARDRAIAPYSKFLVGAALQTADGAIVTGCNIENASFGLTLCAERVALVKALSEGHRAFSRLVIVTAAPEPTPPCGACRQLLWEFCGDIAIELASPTTVLARHQMTDLLPHPFDKRQLS